MMSTDPQIESDWKSFHSLIKVPAEFKVDERTQCSRDVFKELTQVTLKAKSGQMVTGGTQLHDQKETNLCVYLATMSALRHQLKKTIGTGRTKYAGLEIDEYLERRDRDEKRFERDLAVMIGCVCPRALSGRFTIFGKVTFSAIDKLIYFEPCLGLNDEVNLDSKGKRNQIIVSKNLAQRLTNPTFFEIVGWKRIPFFPNALEQFGFDPDSAELKFEEVELPISIGNGQINNFQLGPNFAYKSHPKTFLVRK